MKRILAVLIVIAALSALLCGCANDNGDPNSSYIPEVTSNVTSSPSPATPKVSDNGGDNIGNGDIGGNNTAGGNGGSGTANGGGMSGGNGTAGTTGGNGTAGGSGFGMGMASASPSANP